MPALRWYYLFISHAWAHSEPYYRLENFLNAAPNFAYKNYSVPTHDPLVNPNTTVGQNKLYEMLAAQIRPAQCVLVIAGMYAAHRFWIDKEIAIAQMLGKPIVGVIPWGQERIPQAVQLAAREMVGWNTDSIVSAVRRNAL